MNNKIVNKILGICCISLIFSACSIPKFTQKAENMPLPKSYSTVTDTSNSASIEWDKFFTDPFLKTLIDSALNNNQELNIILQEISISKNEVRARKGEYLPFVSIGAGAAVDKVGRYTRNGALEANTEIADGEEFPEPFSDLIIGANVSWELDVWKKLRNAKKSAVMHYLASIEGKNFMVTNLVSEMAHAYYELMALDKHLEIVKQNIAIQTKALAIVELQKQAAKTTELAVKKFEAEVLKNKSLQFYLEQEIIETENKINFLVGRYPQKVERNAVDFIELTPNIIYAGTPSQLLENRPDIKQSELELAAAKLDVKVAKAQFYPSIGISGGLGLQAFNSQYLIKSPESLMYSFAGDLMAPLVNRNAIKSAYKSANNKQLQAVYNYQKTVLNAYIEVSNQISKIENLDKSYDLKKQQVGALTKSIAISTSLFKSARADYMEVLLTQRDALEAKMELIETKLQQMNATITMYQSLGGGWK